MNANLWHIILAKTGLGKAPDLTCEECLRGLEYYIDWILRNGDPQQLKPTLEDHLRGCDHCRIQLKHKLENLKNTQGVEGLESLVELVGEQR
jgi:hypothetical protein